MKPLVSILIPTYGQDQYIGQAIQSALDQTYPNTEIIIGDDNSPDGTQEVVQKYLGKENVKYIRNKKNLGRVGNYHSLLYDHAEGKYVINLDGDDFFYDKTYIENAVTFAENNSLTLVFGQKGTLLQTSEIEQSVFSKPIYKNKTVLSGNEVFLRFAQGETIPHISTLYLRSSAISIDYYRHDIISADWESVLRLLIDNRVGYLPQVAGMWRKHLENESSTTDVGKIIHNASFIKSTSEYALLRGSFSQTEIAAWKKRMFTRYFMKHLIKSVLSGDSEHFERLTSEMRSFSPEIYAETAQSWKMKFIRIISRSPRLTILFFKYILNQESMARELIQT